MRKCGNCKYRCLESWGGIDYCIDYETTCNEAEEICLALNCKLYEEGTPSCLQNGSYCPSSTAGDYSPSSPWNAPGMSIKDFI